MRKKGNPSKFFSMLIGPNHTVPEPYKVPEDLRRLKIANLCLNPAWAQDIHEMDLRHSDLKFLLAMVSPIHSDSQETIAQHFSKKTARYKTDLEVWLKKAISHAHHIADFLTKNPHCFSQLCRFRNDDNHKSEVVFRFLLLADIAFNDAQKIALLQQIFDLECPIAWFEVLLYDPITVKSTNLESKHKARQETVAQQISDSIEVDDYGPTLFMYFLSVLVSVQANYFPDGSSLKALYNKIMSKTGPNESIEQVCSRFGARIDEGNMTTIHGMWQALDARYRIYDTHPNHLNLGKERVAVWHAETVVKWAQEKTTYLDAFRALLSQATAAPLLNSSAPTQPEVARDEAKIIKTFLTWSPEEGEKQIITQFWAATGDNHTGHKRKREGDGDEPPSKWRRTRH